MEINELKVYEPKERQVKLSPAACQAWVAALKLFLDGRYGIKYIVIPVIKYSPNSDSSDGEISSYKFISVTFDTIEKEIGTIPTDTFGLDLALNRNIMVVEKYKLPTIVTLDIIDVDPSIDDITPMLPYYTVLKTGNGFHLYAKQNIDKPHLNGGHAVKDKQWKMEYIRITESAAKGAITKFE